MKKIFLFLLLASLSFTAVQSQILDPVKWSTSIKKISETEYDLVSKATIEDNWHLYSQVVPEDGPLPTVFNFEANSAYKTVGKIKESKGTTEHDPVFDMVITFFSKTATFTQRIALTGNTGTTIKGEVEYMVCDDTRCLPPNYIDLVFKIPAPTKKDAVEAPIETSSNEILEPSTETVEDTLTKPEKTETVLDSIQTSEASQAAIQQTKKQEEKGLWTIFFLAFFPLVYSR